MAEDYDLQKVTKYDSLSYRSCICKNKIESKISQQFVIDHLLHKATYFINALKTQFSLYSTVPTTTLVNFTKLIQLFHSYLQVRGVTDGANPRHR